MREITKTRLKRLVVGVVVGLQLNTVAFYAWADAVTAGAELGQQTVQSSIQAFDPSAAAVTLQELFPDLAPDSLKSLEDVYGDESGTVTEGVNANKRLNIETSMDGEAYRTLVESNTRISPDLSKDPLFNTADQVRNADFITGFKENFADCKATDVFENVEKKTHVAKYRTCERVADQGGDIQFKHEYKAGVVEYVSGQPNYQSCGVGCLYIWVGTVGDNYWGGHCQIYEEYTRFRVINKGAIISAVIEQATFDDYFQIYFNNEMIWTHSPGVFPPETSGSCERATSWRVNPNTNVTSQFLNSDDVITFKTRTSVTGGGEGYARIRIQYDPAKAFQDHGWSPEDKLPTLDMIQDGFCSSATVQCETMGNTDSNGCLTENGVVVCPDQVTASPHPSLSPFCKVAGVSAECKFYKGDLECYRDAQGELRCPVNDGGNLNSCQQFEDNPSCGFISQSCVKGADGDVGGCYAFSEVWDCGYDVTYPTVINSGQTIDCPGGARCMGSECFDNSNVKSGDFAYAVAMLQVAQFAEHDLDCGSDGTDIETANDCKVFKGEAMECKKALGGYVDCCEAPESVSIFDYVNLTMNTLKMTSSIEALSRGQYAAGSGYWAASTSAITSGAAELIKGEWGSIVDSATGAFQKTFADGAQGAITSKIQQWLMQKAYDAMVEMGASTAANAVFQTGTNAAGEATIGLSSNAAMVVNIIGWVYMVYVIVDLLINIIWECEEKEFELGAKKETRQCHFVGSYCASKALGSCVEKRETYCCFGSVVGRIIQESAREQLGLGWGEVETPSCEGITPDQMAQMDWNRVDLSEWIGMLSMADRLPTMNTVSLDHLTGEGSRLQISESDTRLNSLDRNMERFKDFDADEIKRKAEQEMR